MFLMLLSFTFFKSGHITAETTASPPSPCDIHQRACTQPLSGGVGTVTLNIAPKPVKAMADLTFTVQLAGNSSKAPLYIDLDMPGMKMGQNRVELKQHSDGSYTGSGVIVRCPSGKTLWQATVTVPGAGTAAFVFNAVY
ncbi:MAG: hypothetical protein RBT11_20060 [Desulfobacterales bacterium]|nr:hypothetical protein [Desulfobacterales bacterium]